MCYITLLSGFTSYLVSVMCHISSLTAEYWQSQSQPGDLCNTWTNPRREKFNPIAPAQIWRSKKQLCPWRLLSSIWPFSWQPIRSLFFPPLILSFGSTTKVQFYLIVPPPVIACNPDHCLYFILNKCWCNWFSCDRPNKMRQLVKERPGLSRLSIKFEDRGLWVI